MFSPKRRKHSIRRRREVIREATRRKGRAPLLNLGSGTFNTAVGLLSVKSNTQEQFNTAVGAGALFANAANDDTGIGAGAL